MQKGHLPDDPLEAVAVLGRGIDRELGRLRHRIVVLAGLPFGALGEVAGRRLERRLRRAA